MIHAFDVDIAAEYGVIEAILLEHIGYWVTQNAANGTNFFDGKYWTFNSNKAFAKMFPYLTERQIRYSLEKLVAIELVETGCYNKTVFDRTLWYTLTEKGKQICHIDLTKLSNDIRQNCQTNTISKPLYNPPTPLKGCPPECSVTTSKNSNEFSSVVPTHSAPKGENAQKRFRRPSVDEVRAYCQERKNAIDPQGFVDFYESKGWMVGKNPMRDWKAAVRTWERTEHERKPKAQQKQDDDMATDNIFLRMWDEEFGGKQ